MAKKKKKERLQALLNGLGPLLITLMVILTAPDWWFYFAKALAAVIVVVTIEIKRIVKDRWPDIIWQQ